MSSRKGVFSPGEKGPLAPSQAGFWSSSGIFSRFCLREPMVNAYFIETVSRSHNTSHSKSCVGLRVRRYPYPVPSPGERRVMRFLLSRQQVRLVIGAVMPLLIQGSFAPWSAWAGCNHLVRSNGQKHGASVNLDALITGRTSTEIESDPAGDLATRPKPSHPLPCSGPSCSGRVSLPVSASVVGAVDPVQWGVLSDSFDLVPSPGTTEWADESLPDLTVNPSRVFHPPRASA